MAIECPWTKITMSGTSSAQRNRLGRRYQGDPARCARYGSTKDRSGRQARLQKLGSRTSYREWTVVQLPLGQKSVIRVSWSGSVPTRLPEHNRPPLHVAFSCEREDPSPAELSVGDKTICGRQKYNHTHQARQGRGTDVRTPCSQPRAVGRSLSCPVLNTVHTHPSHPASFVQQSMSVLCPTWG